MDPIIHKWECIIHKWEGNLRPREEVRDNNSKGRKRETNPDASRPGL